VLESVSKLVVTRFPGSGAALDGARLQVGAPTTRPSHTF
jgi:hypothetical protein